MHFFTGTLAALCLAGDVLAQTSTYFSPGVPTDAPIAGNIILAIEIVSEADG
jgi:hypothetical protein